MRIKSVKKLQGSVAVPGDKSISHRGIMLGALAEGTTRITNFLQGADCLSTINCFRKMGISIDDKGPEILIQGKGLHGLTAPSSTLDVGNSGTTTRLISGILAGQQFTSHLTGDESIQSRPMGRIMAPLSQMGATVLSDRGNGCAPLTIEGAGRLRGIHYHSPVASAQVKSCVLLAGMYGDSTTSVTEPALSRNHSELMLSYFGAEVRTHGLTASIEPEPCLSARDVAVPGDISSAAYFIAAGLLVPNSQILIKNVGINPTRDGLLKVCRAMGADIRLENIRQDGEPAADLLVNTCPLHGTVIEGDMIPTLIDEIPVIAVMAACAQGDTVIKDAAELKVKESNRIDTVVRNLSAMGADITGTEDGMVIHGGRPLHGAAIQSYMDHRIAMSFAVAALAAEGTTEILDGECVKISYPDFYKDFQNLSVAQ